MCWFLLIMPNGVNWKRGFQYIKCVGFSAQRCSAGLFRFHFNTSNVLVSRYLVAFLPGIPSLFQYIKWVGFSVLVKQIIVYHFKFQYIKCVGFSAGQVLALLPDAAFQYIKCVGFSNDCVEIARRKPGFQYIKCVGFSGMIEDWKADHAPISIHQMCWFLFGTRHHCPGAGQISIHQMCWFLSGNRPELSLSG